MFHHHHIRLTFYHYNNHHKFLNKYCLHNFLLHILHYNHLCYKYVLIRYFHFYIHHLSHHIPTKNTIGGDSLRSPLRCKPVNWEYTSCQSLTSMGTTLSIHLISVQQTRERFSLIIVPESTDMPIPMENTVR